MYEIKITERERNVINKLLLSLQVNVNIEDKSDKIFLKIGDEGSAEILSEKIKDSLIYEGFDADYEANEYGKICEGLIDKFYEIGW